MTELVLHQLNPIRPARSLKKGDAVYIPSLESSIKLQGQNKFVIQSLCFPMNGHPSAKISNGTMTLNVLFKRRKQKWCVDFHGDYDLHPPQRGNEFDLTDKLILVVLVLFVVPLLYCLVRAIGSFAGWF